MGAKGQQITEMTLNEIRSNKIHQVHQKLIITADIILKLKTTMKLNYKLTYHSYLSLQTKSLVLIPLCQNTYQI